MERTGISFNDALARSSHHDHDHVQVGSDSGSFDRFDIDRSIGTGFCKIKLCAGKLSIFSL